MKLGHVLQKAMVRGPRNWFIYFCIFCDLFIAKKIWCTLVLFFAVIEIFFRNENILLLTFCMSWIRIRFVVCIKTKHFYLAILRMAYLDLLPEILSSNGILLNRCIFVRLLVSSTNYVILPFFLFFSKQTRVGLQHYFKVTFVHTYAFPRIFCLRVLEWNQCCGM